MSEYDEWAEFIVNRIEIIDHTKNIDVGGGVAYVKWEDYDFQVGFSQQDDNRTLKIFLSKPPIKDTKDEPIR